LDQNQWKLTATDQA
jgi:hypothetical protein